MRRPSRQGLIPVCSFCPTVLTTAISVLKAKEKRASLLLRKLFLPAAENPFTERAEKKRLSLRHYPVWLCFIMMTLISCQKQARNESPMEFAPAIDDINKQYLLRTIRILSFVLVASVMLTLQVRAQKITEETEKYFHEIRLGNYPPMPNGLTSPDKENTILYLMEDYLRDSVYAVRVKAHEITWLVASHSINTHVRHQGVAILMRACSGPAPGMAAMSVDFLRQFEKTDFSLAAKDTLRSLVINKTSHLEQLMKLAGFLDLNDLIPVIRPLTQPGNPTGIRWAAYLSLSRMGERSATAQVLERIKKIGVNDDVVYEVFPDLIYTRQPEALTYVIEALLSNEKNCLSADAERPTAIPCGYRIMEQLAPVIVGYPIHLDEFGDLQTDNHSGALQQVREWFLNHKTYTIRNDKF
jgi:hypothetical protein